MFRSAAAFSGSDKRMCLTGPLAVLRCIRPERDPHVKAALQILPSGRCIQDLLPQLDMHEEQAGTASAHNHLLLESGLPSGPHPLIADKISPSGHLPAPLVADKSPPSGHHLAPLLADKGPPSEHYVPMAIADRDTRWAKQCGLCDMLRTPCLQSSYAAMSCTLFS